MNIKLRGLFLNTEKAICSIYESGKMSYDCLVRSENYSLDYVELSNENREIDLNYDFYIFNYHFVQMRWLDTRFVKKLPGFKVTIVLEVSQNSPFDCVPKDDFDAYLVLDPTCKHFLNNVYAFPRPLEVTAHGTTGYTEGEIPVIGTFGLSFVEKGFEEVVKAVNQEFDAATIRINVPNSTNITPKIVNDFKSLLTSLDLKNEIKVVLSNHYFNKEELIDWCAGNTLNVFLYNRRIGNGLSTTTDQAIASGRPLAISTNPTFRHIHSYIKPYPYLSLKESIESTAPIVKKIQEDWSPLKFVSRFEEVLKENNIRPIGIVNDIKIKLPVRKNIARRLVRMFTKERLTDFIPPVVHKVKAILNRNNIVQVAPVLQPFVHQVLQSNSQFQEDLLIDLLMNRKKDGFYIDIGANDPFFDNNTQRFYLRGWRGINIEPNFLEYKKIVANRKFDINLHLAISEKPGKHQFYQVGNDTTLSTLDQAKAAKMARERKVAVNTSTVDGIQLSEILSTHVGDRHIDFMSVDTGGHDLIVLWSNDWDKYRPTLVVVDSKANWREIILFMDTNKYLYLFSNLENALFVDKLTTDQNVLDIISWND